MSFSPDKTTLDEQSNVIRRKQQVKLTKAPPKTTEDLSVRPSPIPSLAAAESLTKRVPTAGDYAIEHSKEPQPYLNIPPACYMYDEDRPWVLGKLNKAALDVPEPAEPVPLPKHVRNLLDALENCANQVIKAQIKASYEENSSGETLDTHALYEKEKAAALANLQDGLSESSANESEKKSPEPITPQGSEDFEKLPPSSGQGDAPPTKLASAKNPTTSLEAAES